MVRKRDCTGVRPLRLGCSMLCCSIHGSKQHLCCSSPFVTTGAVALSQIGNAAPGQLGVHSVAQHMCVLH